ncbi:hypothetical protein BKA64DRAFT_634439 [Cadophora sp. MPI-SDFR-AT-0126]|nr:hypothetical protein BKA64DRAFT_634439 [Leotiomycetes sp. MPI-SDFR-AT-0126]
MPKIHYYDACLLFIVICSTFNLPLLWWFLTHILRFGLFICGLAFTFHVYHGVCDCFGISIEVPNPMGDNYTRRVRRDARREARRYWKRLSPSSRDRLRRRVHGDDRAGAGAGAGRERLHSRHGASVLREENS